MAESRSPEDTRANLAPEHVDPPPPRQHPSPEGLGPANGHRRLLSEAILDGISSPGMAWADFERPILRKFALHDQPIRWVKFLGCGYDGAAYLAIIQERQYVCKIVRAPSLRSVCTTSLTQTQVLVHRPAHVTASVLVSVTGMPQHCHHDKIKWALSHAESPILLNRNPAVNADAIKNLRAFSADGQAESGDFSNPIVCPPLPPMTGWHGWMRLVTKDLPRHYHRLWSRGLNQGAVNVGLHYIMVYDFQDGTGPQDFALMQSQLDFFHLVGFSALPCNHTNWKQGMLIDYCDLSPPVPRTHWTRLHLCRREVETWYYPPELPPSNPPSPKQNGHGSPGNSEGGSASHKDRRSASTSGNGGNEEGV